MNETTRHCPQCKAPLPANAPLGLCPQCLLKAAAPTSSGPGDIIDIGDPAEVAKALPQFEIIAQLGQGGMGVVYKARQRALDRLVALKILPPADALSPDFIARFTREAQSLAKLTHPNIVAIYDFGESGGLYYFSMEYVDGVNLRALLAEKHVASKQALEIVPCICDALAYAHDEGVVHRDIKPENILIDKKGRVKIADFGLAKLLRRESLDLTLTATGVMLGTVRYMAPEQMEKPETVDHRADIYSLGVVFYEMLTGEVPMGRFAPPSATSGVDARLDEIVLHTLEREPSARYQHATEVKTDIEGISSIIEKLSPALRMQFGFEYRSEAKLFGQPLVHVAIGVDPSTEKQRVARGIVAIGSRATGVVAFGGVARGLIAFGGVALGGLTMGGICGGVISMGGLALALFFAYGGLAIAPWALGGVAAGYVASGGLAFGEHVASSRGGDQVGMDFFRTWNNRAMVWFWILFTLAMIGQTAAIWAARQAIAPGKSAPPTKPKDDSPACTLPIRNPAIGLFMTGIFYWATIPFAFFILMQSQNSSMAVTANLLLSFGVVPVIAGALMVLAGLRMNRLEAYRFVLGASIVPLAVLCLKLLGLLANTLAIGPGDIIGAPMGLWALAVLTRQDVKAAFDARTRGEAIPLAQPISKGAAIFPVVVVALLVIGAIVTKNLRDKSGFYTFSGATAFAHGLDGPVLSQSFIAERGFTPTQVAELNRAVAAAYTEFVRVERMHTDVTHQAARVHVAIRPFPEKSLELARQFTAELRGVLGKSAIPEPQSGQLMDIGLFRHAGEFHVSAQLWRDSKGYHFQENLTPATGKGGGKMRGTDGATAAGTFPEEYQVYWTE